ncbi:unnamed protein product [Nyctereutes procyonoides]|uniref:(raccoon dog) hypothetical protein n=1 Tax=Nyctereutes procyonoides TaxID=34880 RepID=A0A811YRW8_NYCPR|nr:unnamed protein product [Nyctereutes procyonoides]
MALEQLCAVLKVLLTIALVVEGIVVAQKTQDGQNIGIKHIPATQCGIWVRTSNGGHFASNYPGSYPPNQDTKESAPCRRIELTFDGHYYIEPSFECRFDHLEVRDGPFGFSPLTDRYCGVKNPPLIRSTGRFMWLNPDFTHLGGILNPSQIAMHSSQVEQEEKTKRGPAVDCIWTIKATPKAKQSSHHLHQEYLPSEESLSLLTKIYIQTQLNTHSFKCTWNFFQNRPHTGVTKGLNDTKRCGIGIYQTFLRRIYLFT